MSGAVHLGFAEVTRALDAVQRPVHQDLVVLVALGDLDFAADHPVERSRVADNIDPLDVNPRPFGDLEDHIDGAVSIARIVGNDVNERKAGAARGIGKRVGGALDGRVLIDLARPDGDQSFENLAVQAVEVGSHRNLAELVLPPLIQGKRQHEGVPVQAQFGDRGLDLEVEIAVVAVVFPDLAFVIVDPVGVVVGVIGEELPPDRRPGDDDLGQVRIGKRGVAQEIDVENAASRPFVDFENDVDAFLLKLDDLGRDGRRDTAFAAIKLDDPLHVLLDARDSENAARGDLHLISQLVLFQRLFALEDDPVDDRVFLDLDDHVRALDGDPGIGKQVRDQQGPDRGVQLLVIDRRTPANWQIGRNCAGLDALIAAHNDPFDQVLRARALRGRRLRRLLGERQHRRGQGRCGHQSGHQRSDVGSVVSELHQSGRRRKAGFMRTVRRGI